ncbi:MAG TPA: hypothetical protein VMW38_07600 [Terriglobia bacterium]|nr:hypothetical protein [Terriglobia bacterium]
MSKLRPRLFHDPGTAFLKPRWRSIWCGGLIGLILTASVMGAYKSVRVKVDPASTYPCHQQQGSVTIAADAYWTKEKIRTAFDVKDLDKMGIVPIHIIVTNDGEDPVLLSGQDVTLLDPKNHSIAQTPVDEVVQALVNPGKGSSPGKQTPMPFPVPKRAGPSKDAFEIETDFTNKALKEARVAPKSTSAGFVFFQLRDNQKLLNGYKIYIPEIRNLRTQGNLLFFEIELK